MKNHLTTFLIALSALVCAHAQNERAVNIITTDVANFWEAYDHILATPDTALQMKYLDSLYLAKGTAGLKALMQVRSYTPEEYLSVINGYPKFWASVRENTLKAEQYVPELLAGIEQLRELYPPLRPADIYFSIGAFSTPGTTLDSLVLIGSELAMTDERVSSEEFPEQFREARRLFFDSNPIDNLKLLAVHECVHTQQQPMVHNLLSMALYEGVAEFVSVKATGMPSSTPAVAYGKQNPRVREQFEQTMFYGNNRPQWLWGDAPNEFGVRDLGYYIGYQLCELHYEQAADKKAAIKKMIELDYTDEAEIEDFVDGTGFFSASLVQLYEDFERKRPKVVGIKPFANHSQGVSAETHRLTIEFSEPMDPDFRNFDYGPLGQEAAVQLKSLIGYSDDGKSLTIEIQPLTPNKHYQLTIGSGFRNRAGVPLKPYLIDFKTSN